VLLTLHQKGEVRRKTFSAIVFLVAALAEAQWLAVFYILQSDAGYELPRLAKLAVGGCLLYALGCPVSLFRYRFGVLLGAAAAGLSWPHFVLLAASIPWRDFAWVLKSDVGGGPKIIALLGLLPATIWSLLQLRGVRRPLAKSRG
jgi:hypothetical protein